MTKQKIFNAEQMVKYFVEGEVYPYGLQVKIDDSEVVDDDVYVEIDVVENEIPLKFMRLKVEGISDKADFNPEEDGHTCDLFIDLQDGCFEEVRSYDFRVKVFWQAFLDWPQRS